MKSSPGGNIRYTQTGGAVHETEFQKIVLDELDDRAEKHFQQVGLFLVLK